MSNSAYRTTPATTPVWNPSIKETQQTQIALAYPTVRVQDPDYYRARAMIGILGMKDETAQALRLARRMQQDGVMMDKVTFVDVLTACAYGGLMDEAGRFFMDMKRDYGLVPEMEHCIASYARKALRGEYSREGVCV